ncbi:MAG: GtrA family protein [Hydrogenophaga sp.]|uniref:GtrA family protein n=1 Tax=Hydrogenophaga sp. TaxID=1904254 RepID=UPI0025C305C4|nr:GtrA family protein [Hydrogenophaga sp.]MBT9551224.1 GtrA family protein [Hydrogenophaga sp.]
MIEASQTGSEKGYLLRYFGAGMVNAATGLGTIALLTALNANPVISNIIGFSIGMLFSFTLAKFFVFKKRNNTQIQIKRYALSFALAYGLNILVLLLIKDRMHDAIAQTISITTYVVVMYILMRHYIFKKST